MMYMIYVKQAINTSMQKKNEVYFEYKSNKNVYKKSHKEY